MASAAETTTSQALDGADRGRGDCPHNATAATTATEQLATSIEEISQRVEQSTRIAGSAEEEAQRTDALVRGLVETGSRIGDVVRLIRARRTCWR